jgi:hypothetical protein
VKVTSGRVAAAIAIGGVVAGTLDIFVAALINHLKVGVILQAIASGLLGRASSFDGGRSMVIGFVAQELMSLIIAAVYVLASVRLTILHGDGRALWRGDLRSDELHRRAAFGRLAQAPADPPRRRAAQPGGHDPLRPDCRLDHADGFRFRQASETRLPRSIYPGY